MLQLCKLDLQLTLMRACALGEDIQDQTGPVNHATLQLTLQVALLTGRQSVIEDDQIAFVALDQVTQLFDLARAYEKSRTWLIAVNGQEVSNVRSSGPHQFEELVRIFPTLFIHALQVNENRSLTPFMAFKKQSGLPGSHIKRSRFQPRPLRPALADVPDDPERR